MNLDTLTSVEFVPLLCGYLYALLVGELCLTFMMSEMRKLIGENPPKSSWQPHVTGCVERTLYILSFLVGKPEFVAAWLVFKVAGGLKYFEPKGQEDAHIGRAKYSNSFTGSAISILHAAVGYLIIVGNNAYTASINDYYGYGEAATGLHDKAQAAYTSSKNPNYFEAGTLVIDLIDSKSYKLLKRGHATRSILRNLPTDARAARLQEVVDEILRDVRITPE